MIPRSWEVHASCASHGQENATACRKHNILLLLRVQSAATANSTAHPRENLRHRSPFPQHHHRSPQLARPRTASHVLITFVHIGFWPEIPPTINARRPPAGKRLSPTHFWTPVAATSLNMLSELLPPRRRFKNALRYVTFFGWAGDSEKL